MSWIVEIKQKLNIVDFIQSDGIELKNEGYGRYSCKCPFHQEKTPSFKVSEDFQNYHCFGCGASGDVIKFFAERNTLDYYTAAFMLAEKLGIQVKNTPNIDVKKSNRQFKLLEDLAAYYRECFSKLDEGHPAKQQILKRNLKITDRFGYAPSNPDEVKKYLLSLGYAEDDLLELGIISDKGNTLLRDRLIFFIRNYMGKVIGFSGRALSSNQENFKYINSKNSKVFDKQLALYNIELAKEFARKKGYMFVVEGQFDVEAMIQNGYPNTVAASGSAITKLHIKEIKRAIGSNGKIILLLDGDEAGKKAMMKVFQEHPEVHSELYIINLPENKDPCDYLMTEKRLPSAHSMLSVIYKEIKSRRPLSIIENRTLFINDLQNEFTQYIKNPQLKEQYLRNGCISAGLEYSKLKILSKKELTKEVSKDSDKKPLSKVDEYYIASLACYVVNKDILEMDLDKLDYPQRYASFIDELHYYKDQKFIPERFRAKRLAQAVSDVSIAKSATKTAAENHYKMLLSQAKKITSELKEHESLLSLVGNLDELSPEEVLKILEEEEK